MIKQGYQITHVAKLAFSGFTPSITAHVIAKNAVVICEVSELIVPLAAVCNARMNHHESWTLAGNLVVKPGIANRRKTR